MTQPNPHCRIVTVIIEEPDRVIIWRRFGEYWAWSIEYGSKADRAERKRKADRMAAQQAIIRYQSASLLTARK